MNRKNRFAIGSQHAAWGLTALIVICVSILFYLLLTKMPAISGAISKVCNILMPVILGIAIAYLILPVYNGIERWLEKLLKKLAASKRPNIFFRRSAVSPAIARTISKAVSTIVSLLLLIIVVAGLLVLVGPQVVDSILGIVGSIPRNVDKFSEWISRRLMDYPEISNQVMNAIDHFEQNLMSMLRQYVQPALQNLIGGITLGVINVVNFLFDFIVGIIVCVYMLNSKDVFSAQAKKIAYAVFSAEHADRVISDTRKIHKIFSGFITGKLIDSLIIGVITFIVLSIMNMPYTVMISVIVGVTNIIPFFGPFIGAIPSAVIIFTVEPVKSIYFIIYIIVIQQIDGNILGPKILGNSTGLPSFWVLFSILVGGGLFGFAGMILGVPVFATIYMFVSRSINNSLINRNMPTNTSVYSDTESMNAAVKPEAADDAREPADGE